MDLPKPLGPRLGLGLAPVLAQAGAVGGAALAAGVLGI